MDFVGERGGGFMMLGGRSSFDAGGYAGTDIADMLPVHLGDRDPDGSYVTNWLNFDLTAYEDNILPCNWFPTPQPTSAMAKDAAHLRLQPDLARQAGSCGTGPGRPRGPPRHPAGRPSLRQRESHRLHAGASWHWQMGLAHTDQTHATFWRQLLRWLVASSSDPLQVTFDREIYQDEEAVGIEVAVKDAFFNPAGDREVEATVASPGATTGRLALSRNGSDYAGRFQPSESGLHQVRIKASRDGQEPESGRGLFSGHPDPSRVLRRRGQPRLPPADRSGDRRAPLHPGGRRQTTGGNHLR